MKMKLNILALMLVCAFAANAQDSKRNDRIEAKKIAYITDKLDLSVEESQKFWPIYNDYQKDSRALKEKYQINYRENRDNMSDQEASQFVDNKMAYASESLSLKEDYVRDLKKILSIQKVATLVTLDNEFKRKLLKRFSRSDKMDEKKQQRLEKREKRMSKG